MRLSSPSLILLLSIAGCSFAIDTPPDVLNQCSSNADCPGAMCDPAQRMCLTPTTDAILVGFEVVPPASSNGLPIPQVVDAIELTGPGNVDFELGGQIAVVGDVCAVQPGSTECLEHVPASIRFVGPGLTGPIVAFETITSDPMAAPDGAPADYIAHLLRGHDYDVIIEPVGDAARRFFPIRRTLTTPESGDILRFQFLHWGETQPFLGAVIDETEQPISGLNVRAIQRETGELVSSVAVTDVDGFFQLAVEPAANFVIQITGDEDRPVFPTLTQDPDFFYPVPERKTILVPAARGVSYSGTVVRRGSADVVKDAVVVFRADDVTRTMNGLGGSFTTTARTDSDGVFDVSLLPGTYDVLVTPPPTDEMGATSDLGVQVQTGLMIGEGATGMQFELPVRVWFSGDVSTPDRRVMEGVRVHAIALQRPIDGVRAAEFNRSSDQVSDPMGGFVFPLDAGVYDLIAKPPPASRFPWHVQLADEIVGQSDVPRPTEERSVMFRAPLPVRGRVIGPLGTPLAGAEIRAFGIVTEGETSRAVEIGRATSDESGDYQLLLPPTF
jgi:hypothetical protein